MKNIDFRTLRADEIEVRPILLGEFLPRRVVFLLAVVDDLYLNRKQTAFLGSTGIQHREYRDTVL